MPLKLNADAGESYGPWVMGQDETLMPYIDMANLACGFHASDPDTLRKSVRLATQHRVLIGAHPSYQDRVGFGRRSLECTPEEIENLLLYQLGALSAFCAAEDTELSYVKPHGALYHDMMRHPHVFAAILKAVQRFDSRLPLVILATADSAVYQAQADEYGIQLLREAFADRAYQEDGFLAPRSQTHSVYSDPGQILAQAHCFAQGQPIQTLQGQPLNLQADLLCVHGDNPESLATVKAIRELLDSLGEEA
ncbi:5-oxoprolinase subunit PxpA [Marinospirillum sp.]|uniref:5-oxoprolinase subunit PxpA n=1 Tax=Marinospirillum sp. TaxID=2183934 RepID=UPI00384A7D49